MHQAAHPTRSVATGHQSAIALDSVSGALAIGLDIECSNNLPPSGDPWSETFYLENFTSTEIDWCLRQSDSQLSFCHIWAAKEAALKCGRELAVLHPIEIEVRHDDRGRPILWTSRASHQAIAADCILSIGHAGKTCMALCIRQPAHTVPDSPP